MGEPIKQSAEVSGESIRRQVKPALRTALVAPCIRRLVQQFPNMLNIASVESALGAMKAAGLDVDQVMARTPEKLFQFERRADMIPYDE